MNKKLMALAVAGAFTAPAAALAQSSNVQIFGTAYVEYGYAKQGLGTAGSLVNADVLQTPGSEIGFKGEEDLGGGLAAWFQCASTADFRGAGTQSGGVGAGAQNSGIFCGRNSAVGLKGSYGNFYVGNWDMPMKANSGGTRIVSETGVWGAQFLLLGTSTSLIDAATPTAFSRRQNNSFFYNSPKWNGFDLEFGISTTSQAGTNISGSTAIGAGATVSNGIAKPRVWGVGGNYNNGPLLISLNYERHTNFNTLAIPAIAAGTGGGTSDSGYTAGIAYQFGPVKAGLMYAKQQFDGGSAGTDASVDAWNLAGDWAIQGPHHLLGGFTKANSTRGTFAAGANTLIGNRVFNGGAGATGAVLWQVEYQYWLSKRTRVSLGYIQISNDVNARYNLGGFTLPTGNQNQSAVATSIKTTF